MTLKAVDMFGGIGGFRHGLENSELDVEFVDYIDQDKYAVESYNEIFNEDHEPKDATEVKPEEMEDFNILCAGFPCQSFSIAGNRGGFEDTRGTLFFEIARIVRRKLPEILLLENVKGLLSHADGETFRTIIQTLDELGYDVQWQVLNSKYHGVPQNRERVIIVASHRRISRPEVFPIREPNQRTDGEDEPKELKCINPKDNHHYRVYQKDGYAPTLMSSTGGGSAKHPYIIDWRGHKDKAPKKRDEVPTLRAESHGHQPKILENTYGLDDLRIYDGSSPVVRSERFGVNIIEFEPTIINHQLRPKSRPSVSEQGQSGGSGILFNNNYSYTLSKSPHYIQPKKRIRKLTPKECWRLQGFPDSSFEAAQKVNSDTQLYKQAGNAVTTTVIEDVGNKLAYEIQ